MDTEISLWVYQRRRGSKILIRINRNVHFVYLRPLVDHLDGLLPGFVHEVLDILPHYVGQLESCKMATLFRDEQYKLVKRSSK